MKPLEYGKHQKCSNVIFPGFPKILENPFPEAKQVRTKELNMLINGISFINILFALFLLLFRLSDCSFHGMSYNYLHHFLHLFSNYAMLLFAFENSGRGQRDWSFWHNCM